MTFKWTRQYNDRIPHKLSKMSREKINDAETRFGRPARRIALTNVMDLCQSYNKPSRKAVGHQSQKGS